MHPFWPTAEPILTSLRPRSIVYVGAQDTSELRRFASEHDATLHTVEGAKAGKVFDSLPKVAGDADVVLVEIDPQGDGLDSLLVLLDALSPGAAGGFPVCLLSGAADERVRQGITRYLTVTSRDLAFEPLPGHDDLALLCERDLMPMLRSQAAGGPRSGEAEGQVAMLEAVLAHRETYIEALEGALLEQSEALHATWSSRYWQMTKPLQRLVGAYRDLRNRRRTRGGGGRVAIPLASVDWAQEWLPEDQEGRPARWSRAPQIGVSMPWRLEQQVPSRLTYLVDVPPGASISARVAVRRSVWAASNAAARVHLRALGPGDEVLGSASAELDAQQLMGRRPSADLAVGFGAGGQGVRLILETEPLEVDAPRTVVAWQSPVLQVPAPAGIAPEPAPSTPRPARTSRPAFSIVMPVHDPPLSFLERAIESVLSQTYSHWQLCIADDGSRDPEVIELLRATAARDERVVLVRNEEGGGISVGTNRALELATEEYVALFDHDDELEPEALEEVAAYLRAHPGTDIVYTDEDRALEDGSRFGGVLKPGYSPELLRSGMYTCHLGVYRRSLVQEVGGFRKDFDGSQDFDLMLRLVERTERIGHVPKVLYHWRASDASVAVNPMAKPYAYDAGRRAVQAHLERTGVAGEALRSELPGLYRVVHEVDAEIPISIVLGPEFGGGDAGRERGIEALKAGTARRNWDVVDDLSRATGEHVVFLDAPCRPLVENWLDVLLGFSALEGVGAVGAKVLRPDGVVEHAGVVIGEGLPLPAYRGVRSDFVGYLGVLEVPCNYLAVAGVFMAPRRALSEAGGLRPGPSPLAEVDYCLRARGRGLRSVFAPDARLALLDPPATPAIPLPELAAFKLRWQAAIPRDPYYHPNFWVQRAAFPSPPAGR